MVRVSHTSLSTLSHSILRRIRLNILAEFISSAWNIINFRLRVSFSVINLYNKVSIIFSWCYSVTESYWATFVWYCRIRYICIIVSSKIPPPLNLSQTSRSTPVLPPLKFQNLIPLFFLWFPPLIYNIEVSPYPKFSTF